MYEIIIGRTPEIKEKYGKRGAILLGKNYVSMGGIPSLANEVYLDVSTSHVIYVCGKRGSGKSYTLGVIAEGMARLPQEIKENLSIVILDTMGIYWTMRYPNKRDKDLLEKWNLKPASFNVNIYTPEGFFKIQKEKGIIG